MKKIIVCLALIMTFISCEKGDSYLDQSSKEETVDNNALPTLQSSMHEIAFPSEKGTVDSGYYRESLVYYRKVGNFAIIGGDIAVSVEQIRKTLPRGAVRNLPSGWPNSIVYYTIDEGLPNKSRVHQAISHWENNSALTFVYRTTQSDYITFHHISEAHGIYSSSVGKAGGQQFIHLANYALVGSVMHEIGHAIGLFHEHTRADRDNFVTVNFQNMSDNYDIKFQFYKYPDLGFTGSDIGATLDFGSIMLYDSYAFSNNGRPTITRLDGSVFSSQRVGLSLIDRRTAHWAYSFSTPAVIHDGLGAGVACQDINGNGIPDLFLMCNDAPVGQDNFRYKIGFDINSNGKTNNWSSTKFISGLGHGAEGADISIARIDNNNIPDIVLMYYDAPSGNNYFKYIIGYNLNSNGDATSWSSMRQISGLGHHAEGAGMAIEDLNGDNLLDIIFMANDAPSGTNQFRYKIGYSLSSGGVAQSWSNTHYISGVGADADGAGIGVADFDNNGTKDIILFADDNPSSHSIINDFRYKIGLNITSTGAAQQWLSTTSVRGVGSLAQGAGVTMFDVDNNGVKDILFMTLDCPPGENNYRYRIGFNPNSNGVTEDWR